MDELYTMERQRQMLVLLVLVLPKIQGGPRKSGALAAGRVARCRYKARRTAPLAGCAIHGCNFRVLPASN